MDEPLEIVEELPPVEPRRVKVQQIVIRWDVDPPLFGVRDEEGVQLPRTIGALPPDVATALVALVDFAERGRP